MAENDFLVAVHCTTSGVQGQYMGSDEKEVIYIAYQALNVTEKQLLDGQDSIIKSEQSITPSLQMQIGITQQEIDKGVTFQEAITKFNQYLTQIGGNVRVICDGPSHLRQCLHPDSVRRDCALSTHCNTFTDIRKEFHLRFPAVDIRNNSLHSMAQHSALDTDIRHGLGHCRTILEVAVKLLNQGHKLSQPEVVFTKFIKGHCTASHAEDESVVRLRGLPYQASDHEVARFFRGLNIVRGGVVLCLNPQNRRNGLAYVRFVSQEHRDMALQRHRHHLGNRYIEVFTATVQEFMSHANTALINYYNSIVPNGADYILRVRGLSHDKDFSEKDVVMLVGEDKTNEENVLILRHVDGACTGEAFLFFYHEEEASSLAGNALSADRKVQVQWSSRSEIQQALTNLGYLSPSVTPVAPLNQSLSALSLSPPASPPTRDCVHIKGLSQNVTENDIVNFLSGYQSSLIWTHIHYNPKRKCNGSAYVQMCNSDEAIRCSNECNQKFFTDCTGSRIVEVVPCTQEEMLNSVRSSYFLTHSSYSVLIGSSAFNAPHLVQPRMYLQPQMPAPGLFYYYPTAIPLNGYGGGVMAASPATPMVRYRTAGAYLPAAAAAPTPEMMDYSSLYNGAYQHDIQTSPTMEYFTTSMLPDYKHAQHAAYTH
ncbi:epithelial splicing regulatory protein 2-like [Bolinopsis microptera]|uniref:epithelial splicing regulatory protein 2-like n=1 Tax=Bolinopsis microptera TaxID=2820187 RepID=UPI003078A92A